MTYANATTALTTAEAAAIAGIDACCAAAAAIADLDACADGYAQGKQRGPVPVARVIVGEEVVEKLTGTR